MGWSEKNMCIKCDEGGNLLVCSENGCPIAIHEQCMGCPARFNGAGQFFCPYCLYKQAVAESRQARENAMLKKKALSAFIDKEMIGGEKHVEENESAEEEMFDQPEGGVEVNMEKVDDGKSRQGNDIIPDRSVRTDEDVIPRECMADVTTSKGGDVSTPSKKKDKSKSGENSSKCDDRENQEKQDDGQILDKIVENRQDAHSPRDLSRRSSRRKRDSIKTPEEHRISSAEKEKGKEKEKEKEKLKLKDKDKEKEKVEEKEEDEKEEEEKEEEDSEDEISESSTASTGKEASVTPRDRAKRKFHRSESVDNDSEALLPRNKRNKSSDNNKQKSGVRNSPRKAVSSPKSNKVEAPGRSKKSGNTSANLAIDLINNGKRKRLLWTKEEEEMLKEGLQKFSSTGNKNVPWRKILEFGRHVFEASRTPSDLKDKWRNNLAK